MSYTVHLLKCPSCGGPLDPPADAVSYKCPYCSNTVAVPEKFRKEKAQNPSASVFGSVDSKSQEGYGAQWSEIVELAQQGKKDEAVQKYMTLTGKSESEARYTVDALKISHTVDLGSYVGNVYRANNDYISRVMNFSMAYSGLSLVFGCLITACIMGVILLTMIPVFMSVFNSF